HRASSQRRLDAEDRRRIRARPVLGGPGEPEQLLDVLEVFRPALLHLCVIREVEVTARKTHATLVEVGDHPGAVAVVLDRAEAEERGRGVVVVRGQPPGCTGDRGMEARDLTGDGALAPNLLDASEIRGDGREASSVDAGLVHAARPVVADLLL